jgi:hypothetical protein
LLHQHPHQLPDPQHPRHPLKSGGVLSNPDNAQEQMAWSCNISHLGVQICFKPGSSQIRWCIAFMDNYVEHTQNLRLRVRFDPHVSCVAPCL